MQGTITEIILTLTEICRMEAEIIDRLYLRLAQNGLADFSDKELEEMKATSTALGRIER